MSSKQRQSLLGGFLLILAGLFILATRTHPEWMAQWQTYYQWPYNIVGLGLLLILAAIFFNVPGLLMGGVIVVGLGAILAFQTLTGQWNSWAYLWTLIPAFVGVGYLLQSLFWRAKRREIFFRGLKLIGNSLILFIFFGAILGAFTPYDNYLPAILLVGLGLYLLMRAFLPEKTHEQ